MGGVSPTVLCPCDWQRRRGSLPKGGRVTMHEQGYLAICAEDLVSQHGPHDSMQTAELLVVVLDCLIDTLKRGVAGDVVELGCYQGGTSIHLAVALDMFRSSKRLHVYDSFAGLPPKGGSDGEDGGFTEGSLLVAPDDVTRTFAQAGVSYPVLHQGWFREIPDAEYPEPISFAFFDGDFYQSIMDSFDKVYPKLSVGGVVCVHDYGWSRLPGVQRAC